MYQCKTVILIASIIKHQFVEIAGDCYFTEIRNSLFVQTTTVWFGIALVAILWY